MTSLIRQPREKFLARVKSDDFAWDGKNKKLTAKLTDLGQTPFYGNCPSPTDVSLVLVSSRTGAETRFRVVRTEYSDEIPYYWEMAPDSKTIQNVPGAEGVRVVLYNE